MQDVIIDSINAKLFDKTYIFLNIYMCLCLIIIDHQCLEVMCYMANDSRAVLIIN